MDGIQEVRRSVAAGSRGRRAECLGAGMAQEVIAREDVVDLEAIRAGIALADIALKKGLVADGGTPLAIGEA